MKKQITTLIFDWHGVLDHVTFERFAGKTSAPIEKIKAIIHDDERAYTAGKITPEEFWRRVNKKFFFVGKKIIEKIKKYILEFRPNKTLWAMLPKLKQAYRLAILSDCPADKLAVIQRQANLSFFEFTYFSCEHQTFKAENKFFLNLTKKLKVKPENCLYIDDSPKHTATAKKLGFQTHLFTSATEFKKLLKH